MKNIKCVDLASNNFEDLRELSDLLGIKNREAMIQNKKNGVTMMWLDIENNMLTIAFTVKGDATIYMPEEFVSHMKKIAPANLKELKQEKYLQEKYLQEKYLEEEELELDSILDKISNYGIHTLSESEKIFLDNQ
jgi:hypothetical protein